MPANPTPLLKIAIPYHAEELYRMLCLKCQQSGTADAVPVYTRLLMAALADFMECERQEPKKTA